MATSINERSTVGDGEEEDVFFGLSISNGDLVANRPREKCQKCGASRKFYCYDCLIPMGPAGSHPSLDLPVPLDVILHRGEARSKSTGVHACVLSRNARLLVFPDQTGDYSPEPGTYFLFPADSQCPSTPLEELDVGAVKRIVVVDSTWSQSREMTRHPAIAALPRVSITSGKTRFWRFQTGKPDECLATIEAIHSFYAQLALKSGTPQGPPGVNVDDLLFYFKIMYDMVQSTYRSSGRQFTKRQRPGYIKGAVAKEGGAMPGNGDGNGDGGERDGDEEGGERGKRPKGEG